MSVISLRLPDELSDTLASLAKAIGRSKSYLALDALREYLASHPAAGRECRVPSPRECGHARASLHHSLPHPRRAPASALHLPHPKLQPQRW